MYVCDIRNSLCILDQRPKIAIMLILNRQILVKVTNQIPIFCFKCNLCSGYNNLQGMPSSIITQMPLDNITGECFYNKKKVIDELFFGCALIKAYLVIKK